jgi:uncharacterized membrane protein YqjE
MSDHSFRDPLKKIATDLKNYVDKRIEILSLEFQEKSSTLTAAILGDCIGLILIALGFFFLLFTAGFGLGLLFDNTMLGFLVLSLALLLLGILIYTTMRARLKKLLKKQILIFIDRHYSNRKEN